MAPIKRSRRVTGGDEEMIASSSLRQEGRKKIRLSEPSQSTLRQRSRRRLSSSSLSEGESAAPDIFEPTQLLSTQYEIDRDGGFAHLEHPELDDERATQRLLARSQIIGENHAAENGIIESVTMISFMCHEKLHVTLGPLINFIIGHNGSGKSAILTAITLCLGGKASMTNRGGSLKSFIKEGRDQASLIIRLKNQGADAYQPDIYGETIIVERHFSKVGTSGFKLKNAAGRFVSGKKTDVEEVIEYFQMQIDNPMNILTQDAARQFLNTSTPAQKYRFFVKGVQLEQLDNDYQLVSETADAMEFKLRTNEANVGKLKAKAESAKEKAALVDKHAGFRLEVRRLQHQAAWAQVEEEERNLREREKLVAEAQGKVEQTERLAEAKSLSFEHANNTADRIAEELRLSSEELSPIKEEETEAKELYDAATQEMQNTHTEQRQIRDHLMNAEKKAKGIRRDIEAEQRRVEDANGGAHTQRLTNLELAQQRVTNVKTKLENSTLECPQLEDRRQVAVDEYRKLGSPTDAKRREIEACETKLRSLTQDAGHIMDGFDRRIPRLLNAIHDDAGFREKPIGPIGLHIKLLKSIWSGILEKSIGNILNAFIVTSKTDQDRLSNIMRRLGISTSPILIGNHQPINTAGHEPDEQYDTVLRVLEIDNELVKRQLIIIQAIEQTILVERREDATRILYQGARPQNVKQCFSLHDNRRGWGFRLGYMPGSSGPSISPVKPYNQSPRMKTDIDSQIAYHKDTLQHLLGELRSLQNRQRELQQAAERCTQAITRHKRACADLQVQLQREEDEVERLQDELDRDNVEDGRLEAFKGELRDVELEVELHVGSYDEAERAKSKQNVICLTRKRALEAVKERIADHEAKIRKAEAKSKRINQARQIALQEKNIAIDAVTEANRMKQALEQKRDRQATVVVEFTGQATKICPRVPIDYGETAVSIDAKLTKFTNAIKTYNQKLGGTDAEILHAYEVAQKAYQKASKQLVDLQALLELLKKSFAQRIHMWRKFQRYISARARTNFTYLLSERGFRGKLALDHKHRLLDLQVEPDETTRSAEGRNTKTLSGGEKSFSSICLLLSVWEAMGAPLRCLDEFDVFMDQVNRDVSTKMIIGGARRAVGRQFILITPNAIGGGAEHDKDVKIIRLSDPRQQHLADL